jgi:hypothetical protein
MFASQGSSFGAGHIYEEVPVSLPAAPASLRWSPTHAA